MTVRFRNLDFDTTLPMDQWPAEAIETVIDRGTLSDWRRLAQAIRHNPWGPAARTAETVTSWGEHYGVDALISRIIHKARAEVTRRGRAEYAAQIRSWRTACGMTLREFARAAGTSAPRLSDYEKAKVAPTTDVLGRLRHVAGHAVAD
jgi:DNA-binding transcriptional regulator YiaG